MAHRTHANTFWSYILEERTPRGALQAAEFEHKKLGRFVAEGRCISYIDAITGATLLSYTYESAREAKAQLAFFRASHADVLRRRATFCIV